MQAVCVVLAPGSAGIRDLEAAGRDRVLRYVCLVDAAAHEGLARTAEILGEVLPMPEPAELSETAERLRQRGVSAVLTFSDSRLTAVAALAEQLGLPSVSTQAASVVTSKFAQRAVLNAAAGVSPVAHELISDDHALQQLTIALPAVIKPEHGTGAAHTHVVANLSQIRHALDKAPGRSMVLEERIPPGLHPSADWLGDMVSVDTAVTDGRMVHFGIADRLPPAEPFRETGFVAPSLLPSVDQRAVIAQTEAAIAALGIDHAVVHTELRCGTSEPTVIEVNARLGGYVGHLWTHAGVGSPLGAALDIALGRPVAAPKPARRYSLVRIVHAPADARRLDSAPSVKELLGVAGVRGVDQVHGPGDLIDPLTGWESRILDVWIEAATPAQARERLMAVDRHIAQRLTFAS